MQQSHGSEGFADMLRPGPQGLMLIADSRARMRGAVLQSLDPCRTVIWIDECGTLTGDLAVGGDVGDDEGRAKGCGLDEGQAEAFHIGWRDKAG